MRLEISLWIASICLSKLTCAQNVDLGGGIQTRTDVSRFAKLALDLRDIRAASSTDEVNRIYRQGKNSETSAGVTFAIQKIGDTIEEAMYPSPDYYFHLYGLAGRSSDLNDLFKYENYGSTEIDLLIGSGVNDLAADAMIALDLWMYASHMIYSGAFLCEEKTQADNPDLVDIGIELVGGGMDEFIALWIGEGQQAGSTNGYSLYAWAERAAQKFGTTTAEADVNTRLKLLYEEGGIALSLQNACTSLSSSTAVQLWNIAAQMQKQMMAPLYQWLISSLIERNSPAANLYAKALVPHLSQCRPSLHSQLTDLTLGDDGVDFSQSDEIITILYDTLDCFGLYCYDIGEMANNEAPSCEGDRDDNPILAGFTTSSDVKDLSRLDLDVYQLQILTSLGSFEYAMLLYKYGKNSPKHRDSESDPFRLLSLQELAVSVDRKRSSAFYKNFIDYHSERNTEYGDTLIKNTLEGKGKWGSKTELRGKVVGLAASFHVVYLEAIAIFHDAFEACESTDNSQVGFIAEKNPLDQGAALFYGSMEGDYYEGSHRDGQFLFDLANDKAFQFGTQNNEDYAAVNAEIEDLLYAAKGQLDALDCINVSHTVKAIENLMVIPLLQGVAQAAADNEMLSASSDEPSLAEGEIYALAVLPSVNALQPDSAVTIYDNSVLGGSDLVPDGSVAVGDAVGMYVTEGLELSCRYIGGNSEVEPCRNFGGGSSAQQRLQNAKGTKFFGMDDRGYPVVDAYDQVLDLHMTMTEENFEYLKKNVSYEVYKPFLNATVFQGDQEILSLSSPGRIRPKGQSTLFIGACMGSPTVPFQIDFDHTNSAQTLFGVERAYLRIHLGDNSYMRDWAHHRMLARFGLPHLRARKVRFFINGEKQGFYTLLEAPDQEYVFARNFPSYNPSSFALFKVKSLSIGCGLYSDGELEQAQLRINETNTPPYSFERGEHRKRIDVLGWLAFGECLGGFYEQLGEMRADTILAYLRYNKECVSMLVDEGLVDLDIGSKEWEDAMKSFIADNLATKTCTAGCANSNLASEVDHENFLKNFAVYAVTLNQDSPMGNGNNYYLAEAGDGTGWKIVPYDHNTAGDATCDPTKCNEHLIHWSIIRPTCGSLESNQLVGPLLTNLELHTQYIEYVRSFVDTVLTNQSFIEEMSNHAQAIQDDVTQDFWSTGGVYYSQELSPDASEWNLPQMPFLPMLKARAEDVYAQLEALDAGIFPRGPHLEVNTEPDEKCVDWRTTEPPAPICYEDCEYAGCLKVGWTVPSFCDEQTATCYHGDYDEKCKGLDVGDRYDGMENREGGFATFCSVGIDGVTPIKASECPSESIGQCFEPTDCMYDGCHFPDWSVASTCSDQGICYHGDVDEKCRDVPLGQRYEGMENQVDGRVAFCAEVDGTPLKVSECPLPDETTTPTENPSATNPEPATNPLTNETETPSTAMHYGHWWVPAFLISWVASIYCFV